MTPRYGHTSHANLDDIDHALIADVMHMHGYTPDQLTHTPVLDALVTIWEDGFAEETGDVDAPGGYAFLVDRWIVTGDEKGFGYVARYDSATDARAAFAVHADAYAAWLDATDDEERA